MKPRKILTVDDTCDVIDAAVREHALAVISVCLADQWITFKSHFLERDPKRRFVVLDFQPTHGSAPPVNLGPGHYVGISFRYKSRKVMFASVLEARGKFVSEGREEIAAVRYRWPETLTELQRRAYYRTPVPAGVGMPASLWAGGVTACNLAQQTPLGVLAGDACDISCGGTLIRVADVATPNWEMDQTLGLELHLPDGRPPLMINGYYRGARHDDQGNLCIAVQFVGLELTLDGRNVLQRLARCVQKFHRIAFTPEMRTGSGSGANNFNVD